MPDMHNKEVLSTPEAYPYLLKKAEETGFNMSSDLHIGSLLKTLISSKPSGHFLELGTGIGLSLSWMLDGMDENGTLVTVDNDPQLIKIASDIFGKDHRLKIICQDGSEYIEKYEGKPFDLIFADAWPGKYSLLDETLALLKSGGFYIIDDMKEQPNWPEGHAEKAAALEKTIEKHARLTVTKMDWSTGVMVCVKK
jgi:predicted O-methyltransferase YrrM